MDEVHEPDPDLEGPSAMTALVVDDSAVARRILSRALRLSGIPVARVVEAEDGAAALAALERNRITLALVDLNMPIMGGMELLEKARRDPRLSGTSFVVVSTEGSETQVARVRALEAGFLRKPFTPESLVLAVQTIAAKSRDPAHDRTLFRVAANVFAEFCFLIPEDEGPLTTQARAPEDDVMVRVRYSGANAGHLDLGFAGLDLAVMAGDMMGLAPDPTLALDAARELSNVICGHALPAFYGAEPVFRLHPPEVGVPVTGETPPLAEATLRFRGGLVHARFHGRWPK